MSDGKADFTLVFRHLSAALDSGNDEVVTRHFNQSDGIVAWLGDWRARLHDVDPNSAIALMRRVNPVFIPRNHRVEEAIQAGIDGDYEPFHRLNEVQQKPFTEQGEFVKYEAAPSVNEVVHATFCGT